MTTTAGKSRIYMNPAVGFKIQAYLGGTWKDRIALDTDGDITFSGKLSGPVGQLGGFTINSTRIYKDATHYLDSSNNSLVWGALRITSSEINFDGNIYARNIQGLIYSDQIDSISADKISVGTLSGMYIYGSTIAWPGVTMYGGGVGTSQISVDRQFTIFRDATKYIRLGDSYLDFSSEDIRFYSDNPVDFSASAGVTMGIEKLKFSYEENLYYGEIGMDSSYSNEGLLIYAPSRIKIDGGEVLLQSSNVSIAQVSVTPGAVRIVGICRIDTSIYFANGSVYTKDSGGNNWNGISEAFTVRLSSGATKLLTFVNGIYIG